MDCSPPGSSIHGIFQARVLESLVNREIQIKTTMRDYLTPVKTAPSKRREMTNAGEDVETRESLYIVGGIGKWYSQYRKEYSRS